MQTLSVSGSRASTWHPHQNPLKGPRHRVSDPAVFGVGTSEFVILTMADDGVAAGPGPRFEKH